MPSFNKRQENHKDGWTQDKVSAAKYFLMEPEPEIASPDLKGGGR